MIETNRPAAAPADDEPDLLRDQFRQLLRYRRLIGAGIGVGLLGGVYLGVSTADTYVATADVVLRAPTDDPFNPSPPRTRRSTSARSARSRSAPP